MNHRRPGLLGTAVESLLRAYARIALTDRGALKLVRAARKRVPREAWTGSFVVPKKLQFDLDLAVFPDCCMAYGLFERQTERVLRKLLRPGDHFVDGGANIGYFTLKAAQLVGERGRVDAFEPQPDNRARLLKNIEVNKLVGRIDVHDVALSDRPGEVMIHFFTSGDGKNHGCSTIVPPEGAQTRATAVRTVRMDEHLRGTTPRLVKLDIEGAEPLAVRGMTGLLQSPKPPAVIIEWAGHAPAEFGPRGAVGLLLEAAPQYQVFVVGARLKRIDPTAEALQLLRACNLLLIPPDF